MKEFKEVTTNVSEMKTEIIKNIFKKLINEIRKHSEKEEIEIINIIINIIFENYKSKSKQVSLTDDLKAFFGIKS